MDESEKSSTWRELAAIRFSIEAFGTRLSKQRVRWHTDSQSAVRIIQVVSMIRELQDLALSVFLFTFILFGYLPVRMLGPIFSVK